MTEIAGGQSNVSITVGNSHNNQSTPSTRMQYHRGLFPSSDFSINTSLHETELLQASPRSLNNAQVYASQLLSQGHGYPLWIPEPYGYSVAYRTKGVRIGDVGVVTEDGGFETLFNIRASSQDPINRRGVPENFEQVHIGEYDIVHIPHYHKRGVVVTNTSVQSVSFGVDFSVSQNVCVMESLPCSQVT